MSKGGAAFNEDYHSNAEGNPPNRSFSTRDIGRTRPRLACEAEIYVLVDQGKASPLLANLQAARENTLSMAEGSLARLS